MAKRVGITPQVYAQPLFDGLKALGTDSDPAFDLATASPAHLALRLRQEELDGAFLSPIDYVRGGHSLRVIPRPALVSQGESQAVSLVFRDGIHRVSTIAADPAFASEIVLAHLILAEKYDAAPTIVPISSSIEESLLRADAVLVPDGDESIIKAFPNRLDLVDEWDDVSGLPFVHGLWVVREGAWLPEETEFLVSRSVSGTTSPPTERFERFRFELDSEANAGLHEFFRFAFYHGILEEIPEVRLIGPLPNADVPQKSSA